MSTKRTTDKPQQQPDPEPEVEVVVNDRDPVRPGKGKR